MSETHISTRQGSLGGATTDQRKSSHRRRLSNEYVNRSSRECVQNSAMDETFLDRFHINTTTPENVWNTSRQGNMFDLFFLKFCIFVYLCLFYIYIYKFFYVLISFKCVYVEDEFNVREDN
jgi:hypothetical protein